MIDSRHVSVVYCDDIRHEVGGKVTLVGCYGADLISEQQSDQPVVLPKLCAHITITAPLREPFKKLVIRAYNSNDLIAEMELPAAALTPPEVTEPDSVGFMVSGAMHFVPFVVGDGNGRLRIEVETETGTFKGNSLRLRLREKAATGSH